MPQAHEEDGAWKAKSDAARAKRQRNIATQATTAQGAIARSAANALHHQSSSSQPLPAATSARQPPPSAPSSAGIASLPVPAQAAAVSSQPSAGISLAATPVSGTALTCVTDKYSLLRSTSVVFMSRQ